METIGVDPEPVSENRARRVSAQVEVPVVRRVENGRRVGSSLVVDCEFTGVGHPVGDPERHRAGVSFLACRARQPEFQMRGAGRHRGPEFLVKSSRPSVEVMRAVIQRQAVFRAVKQEPSAGDAVSVAAHNASDERPVADIALEGVVPENDIVETAAAAHSGSMLKVYGSMSTNTGVPPIRETAVAVEMNEMAGTITSSPGPTPATVSAASSARVPLATLTPKAQCWNAAKSRSNRSTKAWEPPHWKLSSTSWSSSSSRSVETGHFGIRITDQDNTVVSVKDAGETR